MAIMLERIYTHFCRYSILYLWSFVAYVAFANYFIISINVSVSLPGSLYLIHKGEKPKRGDFVAFNYTGDGLYQINSKFLKRLDGIPGDVISANEPFVGYWDYFVNGKLVGRAQPKSTTGNPLQPGPTGIIPAGKYYVTGTHPYSLDSRYDLVGWVTEQLLAAPFYFSE